MSTYECSSLDGFASWFLLQFIKWMNSYIHLTRNAHIFSTPSISIYKLYQIFKIHRFYYASIHNLYLDAYIAKPMNIENPKRLRMKGVTPELYTCCCRFLSPYIWLGDMKFSTHFAIYIYSCKTFNNSIAQIGSTYFQTKVYSHPQKRNYKIYNLFMFSLYVGYQQQKWAQIYPILDVGFSHWFLGVNLYPCSQ